MNTIIYLSKETGTLLMVGGAILLFALITFLILRSSKRDYAGRILFPVFFLEFISIFFVLSLAFKDQGQGVGPAVVPNLWMVGILGLSLFLLIRTLMGLEPKDPEWGRTDMVGIFIGLIILYLVLMQYIGYFISTFLFIVVSIRFLKYRKSKVILPLVGAWILFSYFAFYRLLYVPLPRGTFIEIIFG